MTTLLAIVQACENQLGWAPPYREGIPHFQTRAIEVHKLKKAMQKPEFAQVANARNLALALEFSRRRQLPITSPVGLLYRIADALAYADTTPEVAPIAARIAAAITWEKGRDDEDSLRWIHRLVRAAGPGQVDILTEWTEAGRG